MAANTIVFDPSTDSEGECAPAVKPTKARHDLEIVLLDDNSTSDSDSNEGGKPIKRTNRPTIRGCNRNAARQPLEDVSNDSIPSISVYTKPTNTKLFNFKNFQPADDFDDVEEDDRVISVSKNYKRSRFLQHSVSVPQLEVPATCVVNIDSDSDDGTCIASEEQPTFRRSPTPPPSKQGGRNLRKRRPVTPKRVTAAIGNLESLKVRLQKQKQYDNYFDTDDDVCIIDDPRDNSPTTEKTLMVKIRSLHGIQRIAMKPRESFDGAIQKMAEKEGVPTEHIVLYFGDHSVQPYDTPRMLKLTVADILDCHIVRHAVGDLNTNKDDDFDDDLDDPTMVRLRVRSQDKRTTILTIRLQRTDPFEKLMREYAMKCSFRLDTLKFSFDGEVIKWDDTAEKLDLEDDDCIDVTRL